MRRYFLLLCIIMCMTFMFCDVHADPNPTDGTAYAVLTDNSNGQEAGELIFFRSENEYS